MTVVSRDHARVAYDVFAPAYDRFTAHHDQEGWTGLVLGLAREAGFTGTRVLEVGCGTGSAILPMVDRGYEVTGVDISPAMVARARDKLDGRAVLEVGDMRRLPALGEFDLVWALCDAVNYLLSREELVAAFRGMRRNLAPGGVVAFDVDSLCTMRALYSSVQVLPDEDEVILFRGRSQGGVAAGGPALATIEHLRREPHGGTWSSHAGVHRQRHHEEATVRAALRAAGLDVVALWGTDEQGDCHQPLEDLRHNKAVYIARGSAPGGEGR